VGVRDWVLKKKGVAVPSKQQSKGKNKKNKEVQGRKRANHVKLKVPKEGMEEALGDKERTREKTKGGGGREIGQKKEMKEKKKKRESRRKGDEEGKGAQGKKKERRGGGREKIPWWYSRKDKRGGGKVTG